MTPASMKVLAAEDNPVFLSMLRTMLKKWGYDVVVARDGTEAWEAMQSPDAPQLAILDWMMPGMDGVEVCRRIRAADREPYHYVLLLTARTESQDLIEGMEAGADDYLTKPFNAQELRVRLRAGTRIVELQEQLVVAREALREQATHDSLTGLLNRGSILELLRNEIARAGRERHAVSLLMADLDHFKQVNDTYGHLAGDAVLREAARRMKGAVRRYDSIGRYGGEEFLILLPGCEGPAACTQAERIRESLAVTPISVGTDALPVTCSIGVSWRARPQGADADCLIREADLALYRVKNRGRNGVEFAGGGPESSAGEGGLPTLAIAVAEDR